MLTKHMQNSVPNNSGFEKIFKFIFLNACSVISNNTIDYIFHSDKNPCSSNISMYTPHKLEHLMDIKCSLSTVQMLINMVNGCPRKKS